MRLLPTLLALLLLAAPAAAVVHVTGDGSGNTTAPADDPGFANLGVSANSLSGVYLGDRWVLSAHHVGEQGFTFGGVSYPVVPGSRVQLETSPGVGSDLELVRIVGVPPLPSPVLSSGSPTLGETVVMIGNGWNRAPGLVCWESVESPPGVFAFSVISCPPPGPAAPYSGYVRMGARAMRWGRNVVTGTGVELAIAGRTSIYFYTDFDESGVADEAQLVVGDSGGGAFAKRAGIWELVGIHSAAATYVDEGQPAETAVFGNLSLMVDLYPYVPEILAITNQAPVVPLLSPAGWIGLSLLLAAAARRALRAT